jgi:DNA-binding LacI/PurR family transcriptional regulator
MQWYNCEMPAIPPTSGRSPTLEDVAQVAGVSRATVSRVVNNTRNVDPAIHEVVWRAITETGYVPNRAARSLVTRRTGTVALVVADSHTQVDDDPFLSRFFADPYFGRVVGGLMSVVRGRGVQLALQLVRTEEDRARVVADLRQGQADGSVVLSLHPDESLPELLVAAGLIAVLIGRPLRPTPISYVDLANDTGAALAAEHLIARGCQRIAMITGPAHVPSSMDRVTGFRQAMARNGVPFYPFAPGAFTHDSGEQAMEGLLCEFPDVDGVFAANDLMAQGALVALHRAGRRVPEDVAVVGFDDSSVAVAARPALTTVHQPVEAMAAKSAELLLSRVDDATLRPTSVVFSPTLVVRDSA